MYDIIIIGAGPAGLAAAVYGQRAEKGTLLIDEKGYGGQIINTPEVENYPAIQKISGFDFANSLYQQAANLGAELTFEKAIAIETREDTKIVRTESGFYEGRAVIIATGAKNRPLGLEREEELTGRGVAYCATCDGAFYRGKTAAPAVSFFHR
jgi:thioredoxin reductase (NADPH)